MFADVILFIKFLFSYKERRRIIRDNAFNLTAFSVPLSENNETVTDIRVFHMEMNTKSCGLFNVIYKIK